MQTGQPSGSSNNNPQIYQAKIEEFFTLLNTIKYYQAITYPLTKLADFIRDIKALTYFGKNKLHSIVELLQNFTESNMMVVNDEFIFALLNLFGLNDGTIPPSFANELFHFYFNRPQKAEIISHQTRMITLAIKQHYYYQKALSCYQSIVNKTKNQVPSTMHNAMIEAATNNNDYNCAQMAYKNAYISGLINPDSFILMINIASKEKDQHACQTYYEHAKRKYFTNNKSIFLVILKACKENGWSDLHSYIMLDVNKTTYATDKEIISYNITTQEAASATATTTFTKK